MRAAWLIGFFFVLGSACLPDFNALPAVEGEGEGAEGEGEGEGEEGEGEGEEVCGAAVLGPDVEEDWIRFDHEGPTLILTTTDDGDVWAIAGQHDIVRLVIEADPLRVTIVPVAVCDDDPVVSNNDLGGGVNLDIAPDEGAFVAGFGNDDRCVGRLDGNGDLVDGTLAIVRGPGEVAATSAFVDNVTVVSVSGDDDNTRLLRAPLSDYESGIFANVGEVSTTLVSGHVWGVARLRHHDAVGVLDDEGNIIAVNAVDAAPARIAFVDRADDTPVPILTANLDGTVMGALAVESIAEMQEDDLVAGVGTGIISRNVVIEQVADGFGPVLNGTAAGNGSYMFIGRNGWTISRDEGGQAMRPAPNGELLPEVLDLAIDDEGTLWAMHAQGLISMFISGEHPGRCNPRGRPTDQIDVGLSHELIVADGSVWATTVDDELRQLRVVGRAAAIGTDLELPVLSALVPRDDGEFFAVAADGRVAVVDLVTGDGVFAESGVQAGNTSQAPVAVAVDGNDVFVVGYQTLDDPNLAGSVAFDFVVCHADTGLCDAPVPLTQASDDPEKFVAGAAILDSTIIVTRLGGVLLLSPAGDVIGEETINFSDRVDTPLVVGGCAYIANAGSGLDGTRLWFVDGDGLIDEATNDVGDGEVDVIVKDRGLLLGSGKSGNFFTFGRGVDGCRRDPPVNVGTRSNTYRGLSVTPSPEGVLYADTFGQLWLTHVDRPPPP